MAIGVALSGLIFNSIFHSLSGGVPLEVYRPELKAAFMTAFRWAILAGELTGCLMTTVKSPPGNA